MNDYRRAIGRVLALVLFAALALVPLTASAQTDAQKREAKEHYEKATRLYEVEKYAEAIDAYQKVYLLVDDPNMLFNIAQAYRLWGKPDEAVRSYRNYLRRSPNAVNRTDVEKKIADLERTIEERKRAPATPTTPTPTTPTPEVVVPPPPPAATTPTAPPAPTTTTTVEPPPVTVVQPTEAPPESNRGKRILAYSLLIGGGALLATAVAAGAVANQKAKEIEKASKDPSHPPFDPSIEKSGKNANSIAVITGLIGAAAAATGGILLLTSGSSSQRVSLFPVLGPQVAGGGARVTF